MGLDCEYPNSCDCGCQDEPTHTGCKCCGRETKHSDDCLIPENNRLRAALARMQAPPQTTEQSCPQCGPGACGDEDGCCAACGSTLCGAWVADLRAALQKAEAERDALIAVRTGCEKAVTELVWQRDEAREFLRRMTGQAQAECQRAERAEASLRDLKLATLAALTQPGIAMLEENPITPAEVKSAIGRLARERDSERARAEKAEAELQTLHGLIHAYLAALDVMDPNDDFYSAKATYRAVSDAEGSLRRVVEEGRR